MKKRTGYYGKTPISEVRRWKFSDTASKQPPSLKQDTVEEFLKFHYQRGSFFGKDNLMSFGIYKLLGWSFDFRPYMKKFVYKQYGSWSEAYAPNKTALRNATYGVIDEIR